MREAALGIETAPMRQWIIDQLAERGPSGRQRAVAGELLEALLFDRIGVALGYVAQEEAQLLL